MVLVRRKVDGLYYNGARANAGYEIVEVEIKTTALELT